jgi:hypothetical protein
VTSAQQQDQQISDTRMRLDGAARQRFVATGGADMGLMAALEFWGDDLLRAGANGDAKTWARAMTALRALTQQQANG